VSKRTRSIVSMIVVVVAVAAWNTWVRDDGGTDASTTTSTGVEPAVTTTVETVGTTGTPPVTARADNAPDGPTVETARPVSDLPVASIEGLPVEAAETLALIEGGGPYPYDQDDGVFGNREGLLPDQYDGYYREYTVETPGSDDRGARRFIVGADGDVYYTSDHYESFVEVTDAHL